MPLALLLLLLVGGGTSVVAEKALPGDVLYPVKIHVNENIQSALAVTAQGNAEVAIKQATRRLEEVERLKAILGTTTPQQNTLLQAAVFGELGEYNKEVLKVRGKDSKSADNLASLLQKRIDDHFDAFVLVTASSTASTTPALTNIIRVKSSKGEHGGWSYIVSTSTNASTTPIVLRIKSKEVEKKEVRSDDKKEVKDSQRDGRESYDEDEDEDENEGPRRLPPVVVTPPPATSGAGSTVPPTIAKYTLAQVAVHNTSSDCWSVVSGGVYNLTAWIAQHPGGQSAIKGMCGVDATSSFMAQHGGQGNPAAELASFKIGVLQ